MATDDCSGEEHIGTSSPDVGHPADFVWRLFVERIQVRFYGSVKIVTAQLDTPLETICSSEIKRRQKAKEKAAKEALKEAEAQKKAEASTKAAVKISEEEISPNVS